MVHAFVAPACCASLCLPGVASPPRRRTPSETSATRPRRCPGLLTRQSRNYTTAAATVLLTILLTHPFRTTSCLPHPLCCPPLPTLRPNLRNTATPRPVAAHSTLSGIGIDPSIDQHGRINKHDSSRCCTRTRASPPTCRSGARSPSCGARRPTSGTTPRSA